MTERDSRHRRRLRTTLPIASVTMLALAAAGCSGPSNGENALHPKGRAAHKIIDLFKYPFWIAVVIGVGVICATLYAAIRFRERPGNMNPKQVHGNSVLEIGWTIVPAVILIALAVPTIALVFNLAKEPGPDALKINVVGKQWWWEFSYPGQKIVVADEFHIPAGRQVRLNLSACSPTLGTGADSCNVIHSFWIPELAGKQDLVPGRTQKLVIQADPSTAGQTLLGQCAQYCGLSHARMRMRVVVDTPADFQKWVRQQQQNPSPVLDASGKPTGDAQKLVSSTFSCTSCHAIDNSSQETYGPNLTHLSTRSVFASGSYQLTKDNLVKWILNAPSMVPMQTKGCPATRKVGCVGMPSFTENLPPGMQKMTPAEAEEIAGYLLDPNR